MTEFRLARHPEMILQPGAARQTGDLVLELMGGPARVLLVVDPTLRQLGLAEGTIDALSNAGHDVSVFDDLASDPKEASVDAATRLGRDQDVNCVIGLGGGSAIDTAKLVAVVKASGNPSAKYRLGQTPLPYRSTALVAMPTTAGTGAETTGTSIISQADGTKNWFWGSPLKPDMAIMDPELTVGLPAFWTTYTGLDALVHAIESRTNRYRYAENDPLAETAIRAGFAHLEKAVHEPTNIEARTGMMQAAAYGGLAIGNTGCAVGHNIGHALGSIAGIPHGRAVSVALVRTMGWTAQGSREAFERVAQLAGVDGVAALETRLDRLAEACGEKLELSDDERQKVTADVLAAGMVAPANISMLQATARDASPEDVAALARSVAG